MKIDYSTGIKIFEEISKKRTQYFNEHITLPNLVMISRKLLTILKLYYSWGIKCDLDEKLLDMSIVIDDNVKEIGDIKVNYSLELDNLRENEYKYKRIELLIKEIQYENS